MDSAGALFWIYLSLACGVAAGAIIAVLNLVAYLKLHSYSRLITPLVGIAGLCLIILPTPAYLVFSGRCKDMDDVPIGLIFFGTLAGLAILLAKINIKRGNPWLGAAATTLQCVALALAFSAGLFLPFILHALANMPSGGAGLHCSHQPEIAELQRSA